VVDWKCAIDKTGQNPSKAKTCTLLRGLLDAVRTDPAASEGCLNPGSNWMSEKEPLPEGLPGH